ncbi:MAG: hypothetical protein AUI83_17420 [Armatimonadetes bacterium 13_1_40CM_3_65_7]|nr:MAG: hypothetical protein AUI83_17420 [Armatimonadetes bacterium 13_1_40CM_3_65_7]
MLDLAYYNFFEAALDGIPVVVTRTGWTGEVGYEIYLRDGSRGVELWNRIMEAGAPYNIRPTGPSDIRRVEAGLLNYGADMTLDHNPYEVGLDRLVELNKDGEFIGRDALRQIKAKGVARKLVGIEIQSDPLDLNETAWPVTSEGARIGTVTSALYSPRLRRNIGYAMVPVAYAGVGTTLQLETPLGPAKATVVTMPFVDPKKEIPKS